jgi:hypothetical protein
VQPSAVWKAIEPVFTGEETPRATVRPSARASPQNCSYSARASPSFLACGATPTKWI